MPCIWSFLPLKLTLSYYVCRIRAKVSTLSCKCTPWPAAGLTPAPPAPHLGALYALLFIFSAIKYILSPGYSHKRRRALLRREIGQLSTGDCRSAILLAFNFSPFLQIINFCSDKFSIPVPSSYIVYEERLWLQ